MTNPTQKTREAQTRSSTVRNADEPALAQLHDERESPRAERALTRRLRRDAGPDAARAAADPGSQGRPKMAR